MSLRDPFDAVPGAGTQPEDEGESPTDDDEEVESTFDQITAPADPEAFDTTFEVSRTDVPVAPTDRLPIPRPWQGIPRVAVVFNLNYIYDDANDQWVRDTGNSGGVSEVATGTHTVDSSDGSFDSAATAVSPGSSPRLVASGEITGGESNMRSNRELYQQSQNAEVAQTVRYNPGTSDWEAYTSAEANATSGPVDVSWTVYNFNA